MADSDKDILITPNVSQASQPEIKLVGKDNSPMYLKVLDDNTLSFEGTEGQVFSIGPTMSSGDIFSVNDISGIQSMAVNADGTLTIDAQTKSTTIKNNASNTSTLILSNNNADAVDGPMLELFRDSASPADNDHMGAVVFTGRDDAGNKQEYGRIIMHNDDASSGSEEGELVFRLTENGANEQEYMRLRGSSRQIEFNTGQDDIDMTWNSDSANDVLYCNAGTSRVGIKTTTPTTDFDVNGTINATNITVGGGQGSDGQVLTSTGSGVAWEAVAGATDTFVIIAEESSEYISSNATNTNGFFLSYGNGVQNISKNGSGDDFGVILPCDCELTQISTHWANVGGETNSVQQTITIYKNESATSDTLSFAMGSGSGGNPFINTFLFNGVGESNPTFSALDRINLRATGVSGTSNTQIGPARVTYFFTRTGGIA